MKDQDSEQGTAFPFIRRLTIENFRGIEKLVWHPEPGTNVVLGGGDVGKTTILEAIALLLSPTNSTVISDADYWARNPDAGFCIEAVMSLPPQSGINEQTKNAWPWVWDGSAPALPSPDDTPRPTSAAGEPVYCVRVRGTADMDLSYEIVQPDGSADHFSVATRRKIGLVRLGGDDRNDRDLRLIQGSALDRLLADRTLRGKLSKKLAQDDIEDELTDAAQAKLSDLDTAFAGQALPSGLGLGLVGGQGASLNALIGLVATKSEVRLPLASWGSGTRRLASLEIASANHGDHPVMVVDEVERGLEPYRQRLLVASLTARPSQTFLTTHSAAALSAADRASLWYVDAAGAIGRLPPSVAAHQKRDPETFLARVSVIVEGATEFGFVSALLRRALNADPLEHGIWVTDAVGNDHALKLLAGLSGSGLVFAGFADDEGRDPEKWARVKTNLGDLLFRWPRGCLDENIIALVPDERLEAFVADPAGDSGDRRRTLAERANIQDKTFAAIRAAEPDLRALIVQAAIGAPPTDASADSSTVKIWKRHSQRWFKSISGGEELAAKVFDFGLWPALKPQLLPFLNAVRKAVALPERSDLTQ